MNIILSGCTGSMGKVITDLILKEKTEFEIVAGYAREKEEGFSYPIYENIMDIKEKGDILIDFSSHSSLESVLEYALLEKIPVVLASTGYSEEQIEKIKISSKDIPILFSGNMSIGVNVLLGAIESLASDLEGFDIEIIEKHHKYKTDSPSGTAEMLFDAANKGREDSLFKNQSRYGLDLSRDSNEVGMHSIRGGTITGEHSVIFAGLDETIEIKHTASSKKIFAMGALKASSFIMGKEKGLYDMRDVFIK